MLGLYVEKVLNRVRHMRPTPDEATITLRGGYSVSLQPSSDAHERQIFLDRTYEPATLALFDAVLRPGDTMIDVGANLGVMTLHAARNVGPTGRVISLEPHPAYFPRLQWHVAMNGLRNVTLLQVAAGDKRETLPIFDRTELNIGSSSLLRPSESERSRVAGSVTVEPLDDILGEHSARLIKIDVEGYEPSVLRGARKTLEQQPVVCMEVSANVNNDDPLAAHNILMQTGLYAAYQFRHGKGYTSALMPAAEESKLAQQHDNVVYIPHTMRPSLPAALFA